MRRVVRMLAPFEKRQEQRRQTHAVAYPPTTNILDTAPMTRACIRRGNAYNVTPSPGYYSARCIPKSSVCTAHSYRSRKRLLYTIALLATTHHLGIHGRVSYLVRIITGFTALSRGCDSCNIVQYFLPPGNPDVSTPPLG